MLTKKAGKWTGWTFKEFHRDALRFARALINLKVPCFKAVNIIGYNAPEWIIAYYGALYSNAIPVGVYTTSSCDACYYVAEHSEAFAVVAENYEQLEKYLKVWDKLPQLRYAIIYDDKVPSNLPEQYKKRVLTFQDFLKLGEKITSTEKEYTIEYRIDKVKPGNCATFVYTSGTTGPPKAVMLSHDNLIWTCDTLIRDYKSPPDSPSDRVVSFLPLSHVAAQIQDVIGCIVGVVTVYFSDPTALQGSLINYLKDVRPTLIFSVPRLWEKIEEQMKAVAAENGFVKQSIGIFLFNFPIIIMNKIKEIG